MDIYLANLKEKPAPNIRQKDGIKVFFATTEMVSPEVDESMVERNEKGDIIIDYRETDAIEKVEQKKTACKIVDGRKDNNINRELILEKLKKRNVLPKIKKRESQTSKFAETINIGTDLEEEDKEEQKEEESDKEEEVESEKDEEEEEESDKEELEPEKEEEPKKVVIKKKKKVEAEEPAVTKDVDPNEMINGVTIKKRLPISYQHRLKTSAFYMNNRKKFISELVPMFEEYKKDLEKEAKDGTPVKKPSGFSPMIHQKVVSDYLNLYTPYRGLLLFHGLGSGKTCSSIAIAEGMKSQKQIYVLTLASLKANFFNQMKECGDPIYRLDQFWEFISIEGKPDYVSLLSNILSIPESSIKKRKGAWMVNVTKKSNFESLSDEDKKLLNDQIDEMIRSKYIDVNYNGLLDSNVDSKLKIPEGTFKKGKKNPFDDSVVIIDEVHNFVSMIVNKIRTKNKSSTSYKLYEYLMSATNARIVLLSGTPIINYPNEIGVLFNILRGYIKTWTFPIKITQGAEKPTRDNIVLWLEQEGLNQFDYVNIAGENVTITRNPFGFINTQLRRKLKGGASKKTEKKLPKTNRKTKKDRNSEQKIVTMSNGFIKINERGNSLWDQSKKERNEEIEANQGSKYGGGFETYSGVVLDETGNLSDTDFKKLVVKALKKHGLDTPIPSKIKSVNNIALPDDSDSFFDLFVELDSSEMKNKTVFQKRVLGLTSYFKGAAEELYPSYVSSDEDTIYHIERVPMSAYQFGVYEKIREEESKQEKRNKQKQMKQKDQELFTTSSTYKIASRLCCNFAFPDPPGRPVKNTGEYIGKEDMNEFEQEEAKDTKAKKRGGGGDSDDEEDIREIEEDVQEEVEKNPPKKLQVMGDIVLKDIEMIDDKEKPQEKTVPVPETKEEEKDESDEEESEDEFIKVKKPVDKQKRKREADFSKEITKVLYEMNARKEEIFSPEGLKMYSPKFLRILKNLQNSDNQGLHLIYSQFRTLEGVALIKYMLDANGYAQFKIQKTSAGDWEIVESEEDKGKPKYALHTGTESDEEKKVLLNIYNSKWSEAPSTIVNKLQESNIENNFMGGAIKILMITASGAEGINLKNTRFVHIVEPYWNMVRLEQVIGRARRIASHMDLPEELRNVKVYLYMSIIPEEVLTSDKHKSLRSRDISRLTNKLANTIDTSTFLGRYVRHLNSMPAVISTDQLLFERALQKNQVNSQILTAVKESAMDCSLYENKGEDLACYKFGQQIRSNTFESHPTIQQDIADKDVVDVRKQRSSYQVYNYKGTKYVIDKNTLKLYSYNDYLKAKQTKAKMRPIGEIIKKNDEEKVKLF